MNEDLYVTKGEGAACLRALAQIANGSNATDAIDDSVDACNGLHGIGWCDREEDEFSYESKPTRGRCNLEYHRKHAMVALAMAAAVAASPLEREGTER